MSLLRGALLAVVVVGVAAGCAARPVDTAASDGTALSTGPTVTSTVPAAPTTTGPLEAPTASAGAVCQTRYEVADVAPSTTVSAGSSPGRVYDGPPNHVDNNRWKYRAPLSSDDHAAAVTAAAKARPVLEALCAGGDFEPDRTRRAFTDAGHPATDVHARPFSAGVAATPPPGVVYELRVGGRACVMGHVQPGQVLINVDGTNGEGSCLEAASH